MKLTILRLPHLSAQDCIDVKKIWPDVEPDVLAAELSEHRQLYAARFNQRLLAAVRVTITGTQGRLSQLEVREVTRRRGVGLYLIEETLAQNPAIQRWSIADDGTSPPATIAAFMQAAKFERQAGEWVYNSALMA